MKFIRKHFLFLYFAVFSGLLWLLPQTLVKAQNATGMLSDADQQANCKNLKAWFSGVFDWVPATYCTASGIAIVAINTLLVFAGTVAIIFLIIGGFFYLTSAGNEEQAEKGRKILINSVIGLVVIILATTIVRIISGLLTKGS
jgi:hypothetical protein